MASSNTLSDVLRTLGLRTTGGNFRQIAMRIRHAELDTSHFGMATLAARVRALSQDMLVSLTSECTSVAQLLARVGLPLESRCHNEMGRRLRQLEIDTSHFRGRGWSRGETAKTSPSVARVTQRITRTDTNVFIENSSYFDNKGLTRRLLVKGWSYRCAWCGISEWRDQRLVLHLDHINGINNDHRLENLRFLCPNCHSQTETYSNRRRVR